MHKPLAEKRAAFRASTSRAALFFRTHGISERQDLPGAGFVALAKPAQDSLGPSEGRIMR